MTDIRVDAPAEVRFLFQDSQKRVSRAVGVSALFHAVAIALFVFLAIRPAAHAVVAVPEILNTKTSSGSWRRGLVVAAAARQGRCVK
jgi:hypothetical protein